MEGASLCKTRILKPLCKWNIIGSKSLIKKQTSFANKYMFNQNTKRFCWEVKVYLIHKKIMLNSRGLTKNR